MSRLDLKLRPLVAFDADNKQHREWYAKFICAGSWKDCPVRFEMEEACGDLQGTIQRKLLQYYAAKEFKLDVVDNRY